MHIARQICLIIFNTIFLIFSNNFPQNVVAFTYNNYHNFEKENKFSRNAVLKLKRPPGTKPYTIDYLIKKNLFPQPPVFNYERGYNTFRKINYNVVAKEHLKEESNRIAALDEYFKDSSKKFDLHELLGIFEKYGIYQYMSTAKTIEMANKIKSAINREISINGQLSAEIIKKIHSNRAFLRIIGSVRRCFKIIKNVIVREALLDDEKIKKSIPHFSNMDIVDIIELLSISQYRNDCLMMLFVNYVDKNIDKFTTTQLCNIAYHINKLNYNCHRIIKKLPDRTADFDFIHATDCIKCAEALVSFDFVEKEIFDKLASRILMYINDIELDDLIKVLKIFTSAEYIEDDFFTKIILSITDKLKNNIGPNSLISILSSLSNLNIRDETLLNYITKYIMNNFSLFSPLQLASSARYFSMLKFYPEGFFERIFSLPVFSIIPDKDVMQLIRMGYHKNHAYTAYLHMYPLCELDKLYNKIFIAYKAYQLESPSYNADSFAFSDNNLKNLRDIFLYQSKEKVYSCSSLHLEIAEMYSSQFNINFLVEYQTDDGFLIDLAHLTEDGEKYAIEVNGPFHYKQRCLSQVPPPMTSASLFKLRLLEKAGWNVTNISYWEYSTWMPFEKKKEVLYHILPQKIREMCTKNDIN